MLHYLLLFQLTAAQAAQVCADLGKITANNATERRALADAKAISCVPPTPPIPPPPTLCTDPTASNVGQPLPCVFSPPPPPTPTPDPPPGPPPVGGALIQSSQLVPTGTFRLPQSQLGSAWGFGSFTGCCGLGTYGLTFNASHQSLYVGGHPYEQRLAEIKIPASLSGNPVAAALSNLIDPLEGRLGSINPTDPNSKILASALVYQDRLILGAYSYYDGAVTQTRSAFARPTTLTLTGQLTGPVKIGATYPGWVDKMATLVPSEWQAALGGPALACGAGGAINSAQSWGPSCSAFDPAKIGTVDPVPASLLVGYPETHPLANTSIGNALWSQADVVTGVVIVSRSLLFFGYHGMGGYCYGTGLECGDKDNSSKGTHAYPYRSQVWAYDLNDLAAVKLGAKQPYDVKPYATWELDASFKEIQGAALDVTAKRLYVSQVGGDGPQPLIRVYAVP